MGYPTLITINYWNDFKNDSDTCHLFTFAKSYVDAAKIAEKYVETPYLDSIHIEMLDEECDAIEIGPLTAEHIKSGDELWG